MGIKEITTSVTGLSGVLPVTIYIDTDDTVAEVTAVGYLNHIVEQQGHIFSPKQMALVYTTDSGCDWYQVTIAGVNTSLVLNVSPGDVLLPVTAGHIAVFTNVAGQIGDPVTPAIHLGTIQAGDNGLAGTFVAYPAGANQGTLIISATNAGGGFNTTITNRARAQATVMSFADVVSATGSFLVAATVTPFTTGHLVSASGTGGLVVDSGLVAANVQLKTNIIAAQSANIGGAGAGPINIVNASVTAASVIVATISTSSNTVAVAKVTPGAGSFDVLFSADPGAACVLSYVIFVAPQ